MPALPANRCQHCGIELALDIWWVDESWLCERCVGPAEARGGTPVPVAIALHIAPAERERLDAERVRARELALAQQRKRL